MRVKRLTVLVSGLALLLLVLPSLVAAQGGGRGNGGGRPAGNPSGGRAGGAGVDGGLSTASSKSRGRSDEGLGNASVKSKGRSDAGLERARENSRKADEELRKHPQIAAHLQLSNQELRRRYNEALRTNPDLEFGQFVAANRLTQNLGDRHPNITTAALLNGLAQGRSLGQTLQDLGLSSKDAKAEEKRVKREIEESRKN